MPLYEVAVVTPDRDDEVGEIIVPPTPMMALDDKQAKYKAVVLAHKANAQVPDEVEVYVIARPFRQ